MKLRPLKPHVFSAILFLSAVCIISFCTRVAEAGPTNVRRNQKNPVSNGTPAISMISGTNTRQKILLDVDVGETVYVSCHLNKTVVRTCEWFKQNPPNKTKKRITQFVDRYHTTTPCQLQIRKVKYEDAGTIICRAIHADSDPTIHEYQLSVTGPDDPYQNVLPKSETVNVAKSYSEAEIVKDLLPKNRVREAHIGQNVGVKCEANGNPKPLVLWRRGSKNYTAPAEGFSFLMLNNVTQEDAGTYKCEAINIFGKSTYDLSVKISGPLEGASEIIDISPRNVSLFEGNQGNLTCIARFEGDPWFSWIKRIDNKTEEVNVFYYEGHYYTVIPPTETRPLGQKLFAATLLLQNVTLGHSGFYHCIVAGLQGYNHSGAYVTVGKDPSKLHLAQMGRQKRVTILWIFSFLIFAVLVVLCVVRMYGCPTGNKSKNSSQATSSTTSSIMKTQLPKRSPETMSTDCTHPRHEVFAPLVTHGSCSLTSQEPSVMFRDCNSSCRTYNSYDPEFSLPSNTNSFVLADLEAARSSYSHVESCDSNVCSQQSVTSPRIQTTGYYKRGPARNQRYHDPNGRGHYHRHRHQHHHVYQPTVSESQQSRFFDIEALDPHACTQECCNYYAHNQSNLYISSDSESQWNSEHDNLPPEEQSYFLEDEHHHPSDSRAFSGRRKLNPSPNLSFLEKLKANPNTVTAIL
ncbi:unnamed protein product [Orchesella dallaii]|uniref:Ig-like domain-containing protein n=1 Tax=Orchesella dallaii TaxID=48710 RepID=A0ABP1QY15_9HEXA